MRKPAAVRPFTVYMPPRKAAAYIGTTKAELARDREREQPEIPFMLIAGKIRYAKRELDAFLNRVRGEGDATDE